MDEIFNNLVKKLDDEQKTAVLGELKDSVVIANAGSGKTTVLTHRVAYYIQKGIDSKQIMLLTFTNKASQEMLSRVKKLIGDKECNVVGGTFHSIACRFLRKYSDVIGFDNNFGIITTDDSKHIIKKIIANKISERSKEFRDNFPNNNVIFGIYSTAFNKHYTIDEMVKINGEEYSREVIDLIKEILIQYKEEKKTMNVLDFDDLLKFFYLLLKQKPQIREKISDECPYILVDEYQDINWIQNQIIELLNNKYHNLFVVGDKNQCVLPNTKISIIENGNKTEKDIQYINYEDKVVCFTGNNKFDSKHPEIMKRKYNGKIIEITTKSGKKISGTKQHVAFTKVKSIDKSSNTVIFSMFNKLDKFNIDLCIRQSEIYYLLRKEISELKDISFKEYNPIQISLTFTEYDRAYQLFEMICDILDKHKYEFNQYCILKNNNQLFQFIPFDYIHEEMEILVLNNNKPISEKVEWVDIHDYTGYVYDLNIKDYRNYIANDIIVHNCIYGFRGSNPSYIDNFVDTHKNCNVYFIRHNYRSHKEILELAENSINNNTNRYKTIITPFKSNLCSPDIIKTENEYTQANYICSKIKEYKKMGIPYKEIAILVRYNNMTRSLELSLKKYNIPYKILCGTSFFEREHVKDILSFIKYIANKKDTISLVRFLSLFPGIGNTNLDKILKNIVNNDILALDGKEIKLSNGKAINSLETIKDFLISIENLETISESITYIYETFYKNYMFNKHEDASERELDIMSLIESAVVYNDVNTFLSEVVLDGIDEEDSKEENTDNITITSIHKAKGLEWDCIFIPSVNEKVIPSFRANTKEEIEEERRMFYVGQTRARKYSNILYTQKNNFGKLNPSIFIKELNKNKYRTISYKATPEYGTIKDNYKW